MNMRSSRSSARPSGTRARRKNSAPGFRFATPWAIFVSSLRENNGRIFILAPFMTSPNNQDVENSRDCAGIGRLLEARHPADLAFLIKFRCAWDGCLKREQAGCRAEMPMTDARRGA